MDFSSFLGGVAGGSTVSIVIKAHDEYSKELKKAEGDVVALGKKSAVAYAAVATAAIAVGAAVLQMSKEAARAQDVQEQFNKVLGSDGVAVLRAMQRETLGTVDKWQLMSAATAASIRGLDTQYLPLLTRFAMQMNDAGIATGSVTDTVNDLTTALATGRTAALARYGLQLKGLGTDAEKAAEAIKQIGEISGRMGLPESDAADASERLAVAWKELKVNLGEAASPAVLYLLDKLNDQMKHPLPGWLEKGIFFAFADMAGVNASFETVKKDSEEILFTSEKLYSSYGDIVSLKQLEAIAEQAATKEKAIQLLQAAGMKDYSEAQLATTIADLNAKKAATAELEKQLGLMNRAYGGSKGHTERLYTTNKDGSLTGGYTNVAYSGQFTSNAAAIANQGKGYIQQDFVMRPGQGAVSFSPQDTLIGVKDPSKLGGGVTVYIESVQGLDPDAVADALHRSLRRVVSV